MILNIEYLLLFSSSLDPVKLGEIELCAKCSNPKISGRFVYKPPMGTVLKVGKQVLTVKFIPDNQIYFSDNKMSVKVNVTVSNYYFLITF